MKNYHKRGQKNWKIVQIHVTMTEARIAASKTTSQNVEKWEEVLNYTYFKILHYKIKRLDHTDKRFYRQTLQVITCSGTQPEVVLPSMGGEEFRKGECIVWYGITMNEWGVLMATSVWKDQGCQKSCDAETSLVQWKNGPIQMPRVPQSKTMDIPGTIWTGCTRKKKKLPLGLKRKNKA